MLQLSGWLPSQHRWASMDKIYAGGVLAILLIWEAGRDMISALEVEGLMGTHPMGTHPNALGRVWWGLTQMHLTLVRHLGRMLWRGTGAGIHNDRSLPGVFGNLVDWQSSINLNAFCCVKCSPDYFEFWRPLEIPPTPSKAEHWLGSLPSQVEAMQKQFPCLQSEQGCNPLLEKWAF